MRPSSLNIVNVGVEKNRNCIRPAKSVIFWQGPPLCSVIANHGTGKRLVMAKLGHSFSPAAHFIHLFVYIYNSNQLSIITIITETDSGIYQLCFKWPFVRVRQLSCNGVSIEFRHQADDCVSKLDVISRRQFGHKHLVTFGTLEAACNRLPSPGFSRLEWVRVRQRPLNVTTFFTICFLFDVSHTHTNTHLLYYARIGYWRKVDDVDRKKK